MATELNQPEEPVHRIDPSRLVDLGETSGSAADDELAESFALDEAVTDVAELIDLEPRASPPPGPPRRRAVLPPPLAQPSRPPAAGSPAARSGAQPPAAAAPAALTTPALLATPVTATPPAMPAMPAMPAGSSTGGSHRRSRRLGRAKGPWWELPLLVVLAVVAAMLIKTFLVQPFYIPSESMEQTLHGCTGCSGDRILVNKPIYDLRAPHPGDIVVFKAPPGWDDEPTPTPPSNPILKGIRWVGQLVGLVPPDENDLVKRVIATGGQTVQCCDAQGRVQVSDAGPGGPFHSLNEPYIFQSLPWNPLDKPGQLGPGATDALASNDQRTFGPVTVPKGRLWVMGDNRAVSEDSRWHYANDFHGDAVNSTVPVSSVIGKAVFIIWPPSRWRTLGTPDGFKQFAAGAGGTGAPLLGAASVLVLPTLVGRRRRRRRRT